MVIKYRETLSHRYDGDTTRSWKDRELTPDEAPAELENLSEQRTMLWETLSNLRSLRGDLDEETRRIFVNYICMHVFFPSSTKIHRPSGTCRNTASNPNSSSTTSPTCSPIDPHSETWRDWDPPGNTQTKTTRTETTVRQQRQPPRESPHANHDQRPGKRPVHDHMPGIQARYHIAYRRKNIKISGSSRRRWTTDELEQDAEMTQHIQNAVKSARKTPSSR